MDVTKGGDKFMMDENIKARLVKNIGELLNAGWDTGKITRALSAQAAFGEHEGFTPSFIQELANNMCKAHNAEVRKVDREIAERAIACLKRDFPNIEKYFKFRR